MGVSIEWKEEPFEWAWPHRFGVVRRYMRGPITELRVLVELQPEASGGTRLIYQVWAEPCTDRLDYFGSTVNLAAQLEGLSTAHDIIVSDAVATAPDVRAWLATEADTLSIERFETTLKGFDTERFTVCRIRRCGSSDTAPASRVAGSLDAEAKRNRGRA
jgi:hypothetical protein